MTIFIFNGPFNKFPITFRDSFDHPQMPCYRAFGQKISVSFIYPSYALSPPPPLNPHPTLIGCIIDLFCILFRRRPTMLPSTKRNLVLGIFLVIVTLVVLYSYCNGNSVCYTFPLFSGLERDRLVKPEVLVTSVIVQTKRPFDMEAIPRKHQGKTNDNQFR